MNKLRYMAAFIATLVLGTLKLLAGDSPCFGFLSDNAKLLVPIQIIAPDSWDSKGGHDFVLLAQISQGSVQSVEAISEEQTKVPKQAIEALKSWKFEQHASGQFLLLYKTAWELPPVVYAYELLDNKPTPIVKALPSYPGLLRMVVSWRATVEIIIGRNGVPVAATVLSSTSSDYNDNARLAALLYRFEIGTKDGKAVTYKIKTEICFDATE